MKSVMIGDGVFLSRLLFASMFGGAAQPAGSPLAYSEFRQKVEEGSVKDVVLSEDKVTGTLSNGDRFTANVVRDPELLKMLNDNGFNFDGKADEVPHFWLRSDRRRVGKACVSMCGSRRSQYQ